MDTVVYPFAFFCPVAGGDLDAFLGLEANGREGTNSALLFHFFSFVRSGAGISKRNIWREGQPWQPDGKTKVKRKRKASLRILKNLVFIEKMARPGRFELPTLCSQDTGPGVLVHIVVRRGWS